MPNLSLNLSLNKSNNTSSGCHVRRRRWTRALVEEDITVKDIDKVKLGRATATLRAKVRPCVRRWLMPKTIILKPQP